MRDERSSDVLVAGTASPAAQKDFVWERQQRLPTSSSSGRRLQQELEEDAHGVCRPVAAARAVQAASCPYCRTATWLPGLFRFFRTPATNLRLPKLRGAISEAEQKRRRCAATARFCDELALDSSSCSQAPALTLPPAPASTSHPSSQAAPPKTLALLKSSRQQLQLMRSSCRTHNRCDGALRFDVVVCM
jgi:hypothetical protein